MATNTANSFTNHTGNNTAGPFAISFSYLDEAEVDVTVDGVLKSKTTHYTFPSATTISFTSGNHPGNGAVIKFQRDTDISIKKVDFQDGSVLTEIDLDNVNNQTLYALQENLDVLNNDVFKRDGTQTVTGNIVFEGATDNTYETTLTVTDPTADQTITFPDITGTVITSAGANFTGNVTANANLDVDGITTLDQTGVDGSLTVDGQAVIDNIQINGNTINTTTGQLTLNSDNGTVNVDDNLTVNGITTVPDASYSSGSLINNYLKIGSDDNGLRIFTNSGGDSFISEVGTGSLAIASNGSNLFIQKNTSGAEAFINCIADGEVRIFYNNEQKLATKDTGIEITGNVDLDGITGEAVVTSGTSDSDTKVYSAKRCDELYYNLASTEEIQSGETWEAADNKIATTSAIDNRIIDLLDDVGGFVPIANETSFPNANPDINNGAGTLVSVPLANNLTSNSSGVISISNGTVANSTVTINGASNSTTYTQGFGIIVETTSTLNTYTFHRYVPKATEVTTVAGNTSNINTVAGNNANITTVAGISSNITTVAGIASNVTTVANDATDIGNVSGSIANVNTTAGSIANVNTTAGSIANINTTAAAISNVNTVAGISANVTTVAGISSNVTTVANDGTDIGTVAGSISNVNTTAGSIANVNSTAGSIANVNTVATNLTAINNASTYLNNFLSLYLGQASSDPTVDGLGNALTEGDKYFNTVSKQIRVWNGQVWQGIAENTVEVARFANATFSSVYTASAGSNSIDLGGLAVTGAVFSNESIVSTRIALLKGSGTFNLGGI